MVLIAPSSLRTQGPIRRGLSLGVLLADTALNNFSLWLWVPAFAGTTNTVTLPPHTAILRCRTGAPTVRLSAASMMALASMP
ncbi:hypothetical protein V1293_002600 [Bradyrhizobium sp. AZCC 1693]